MTYTVRLSDRAAKDLDRLDRSTRERVLSRLEQLASDPYNPRISAPLTNADGQRKSRVGDWRIVYSVNRGTMEVAVVTIASRGQVYRRL